VSSGIDFSLGDVVVGGVVAVVDAAVVVVVVAFSVVVAVAVAEPVPAWGVGAEMPAIFRAAISVLDGLP